MNETLRLIICWLSFILSIGSFLTSTIFQIVLSIQKFGVIFGNNTVIIPHWSLAFIGSGVLFLVIAWLFGRKL